MATKRVREMRPRPCFCERESLFSAAVSHKSEVHSFFVEGPLARVVSNETDLSLLFSFWRKISHLYYHQLASYLSLLAFTEKKGQRQNQTIVLDTMMEKIQASTPSPPYFLKNQIMTLLPRYSTALASASSSTTTSNTRQQPLVARGGEVGTLSTTPSSTTTRSPKASSGGGACTTRSVQKSLIAGYVAGEVGVIIGYPLDSAKVWLQTKQQPSSRPIGSMSPSSKTAAVLRPGTRAASSLAMPPPTSITTTPFPLLFNNSTTTTAATTTGSKFSTMVTWTRALYRGVAGPLVTVGLVQSLNFALYDSARRMLYATAHPQAGPLDYLQDDNNESLLHVGLASVSAGAVLAFVTSPLVMIKTKQQVQQISFTQAARQTVSPQGGGVARGFGPHFISETAGRGIYFCAYEMCKRTWTKTFAPSEQQQQQAATTKTSSTTISMTGRMISAGVAGMLCWTVLFPVDVVRNRLFASAEYMSAMQMSQRIYAEAGVKGFFRGYYISIFRAGPVAALVLPIYDYTLEHLNRQG